MANEMYPVVTEKNITEFMDICFVLNLMIDQAFEDNLIVLLNEEIAIEWTVIHICIENIHHKVSEMSDFKGVS
jgi:hypothetical protein